MKDIGSAEEQPISNRFDDYTIIKKDSLELSFFNYRQSKMAKKNIHLINFYNINTF